MKIIELEAEERERLGRLHVEWRLALSQAELARLRFEAETNLVARRYSVSGDFDLDIGKGTIKVNESEAHK